VVLAKQLSQILGLDAPTRCERSGLNLPQTGDTVAKARVDTRSAPRETETQKAGTVLDGTILVASDKCRIMPPAGANGGFQRKNERKVRHYRNIRSEISLAALLQQLENGQT
jgi:hypothetical protein